SLVIAASMLLAQKDYMRLLAYSSMQYMALAVFGLAVGTPIAVAATLLHLLGHGLGKAILFCGAGQICAQEGSTEFAHLRAILSRHPTVAGISALALAALLGFPPFSPFASMHTLLSAGLDSGLTIPTVLVATTIVVIFIAVVARVTPMFFSPAPQAVALPYLSSSRAQIAPLVVGLIGLALLGTLSFSLQHLLMTAGMIVTGR
ncbi:MAG: proton-conducting transporter transmembrane domain-containing protein, partial [Mycobacteriaceae bacterium]